MPCADLAGLLVDRRSRADRGHDRLEQVEVDDLASALWIALPREQGHGDRRGRRDAGDRVGEAERRERRGSVGLAGEVGEPAHRLGQGAEAGAPGVRAGLAEPGDPHDHQRRIDVVQLLGADAPPLQRARAEVLHDDVGVGGQPEEERGALGVRTG